MILLILWCQLTSRVAVEAAAEEEHREPRELVREAWSRATSTNDARAGARPSVYTRRRKPPPAF